MDFETEIEIISRNVENYTKNDSKALRNYNLDV